MNATARIAVLKFGGTSVATREQREVAYRRIRDARDSGFATVAVVSAMGRPPEPYATDTLLQLVGAAPSGANLDLLLAAGELISAAIVASELCAQGVEAIALSGAQAGIVTNAQYGDATILRVEPAAIREALDRGAVPVVAGFQGAAEDGSTTTLGRGGTDLSAIAIGAALEAERVDIYTDVSGAMTADPQRIPTARTIERASLAEMTELAGHGAKVMHYKAAQYADRTGTRYAIKGLHSDRGTVVDESFDHHRPVTGVTASGRVTWIRIIRGDIESPSRRMETELEMFRRVAGATISIDQVTINQAGVAFVIEGDRGNEIRSLLGDLNLAVRVREGCSKLSIVGTGMRDAPGVVAQVVGALSRANVEIIHCTDSNVTISVLVPAEDVDRAESAVHEEFGLDAADPNSMISPSSRERLGTILTAMITPFDGAGALALHESERIARWLVERGNNGLVVAGSTGEGQTLDTKERVALWRAVKDAVGTRATMLANAGTNDTRESVAEVVAAQAAGADAILAVVPYYNKPPQSGMLAHFGAIAEATDLPVVIYNIPGRTGVNMTVETLLELARRHRNIAGVKESSGDLKQIGTILRDRPADFIVWAGDDHLFLSCLALGADGVVGVASHLCSREYVSMLEAYRAGDVTEAARIAASLLPLIDGLFATTSPIPVKWAMRRLGFDAGECRLPLDAMPAPLAERLEALIAPFASHPVER